MTIAEALRIAMQDLTDVGIGTARLDALVLLEEAGKKPRSWLLAHDDEELPEAALEVFRAMVDRRKEREPAAYIIGRKEFYGLELNVSPAVLIPRPESEAIVDCSCRLAPDNGTVIDVGTGSGAIAIAIKKTRPELTVHASEISKEALEVAERNAKRHGAEIIFHHADLLDGIDRRFDVIAANLPYIPDGFNVQVDEVAYEPGVALFGGEHGLTLYEKLFEQADGKTTPGACITVEADPYQHPRIKRLAHAHGWDELENTEFVAVYERIKE